ncbi:DgyrCDS12804 [Dimorphilus gyrociliatus]|uniref:DgyrCDS12804 n=1 Tax=Dimorphilus gyrociliatus TaxID=2664684 RepID=A0A7I8W8T2_9ANNE|nr:DgyrCDS12804 [Dimorphilus gyrociliatus]
MKILDLEIDQDKSAISLLMYLRVRWKEPRLKTLIKSYPIYFRNESIPNQDKKIYHLLWHPDFFIANSYGDHLVPSLNVEGNIFFSMQENTEVTLSVPISTKIPCPKTGLSYGSNIICNVRFTSYKHNKGDVKFIPSAEQPISFKKDLELTKNLKLESYQTSAICRKSQFPCTDLKISFKPSWMRSEYQQAYTIGVFTVIASWIGFWLEKDRDRILLSTLLVTSLQIYKVGFTLSCHGKIGEKAIELWLSICIIFILLTIFQFAIVRILIEKIPNTIKSFKRSDKDLVTKF